MDRNATTTGRLCRLHTRHLDELRPLIESYRGSADWPWPLDADWILDAWQGFLARGMGFLVGWRQADELLGFASVLLYPDPVGERLLAAVQGIYLSDRARQGGAGDLLLAACERVAAHKGAAGLVTGHNHRVQNRPAVMARWLRRKGYRPVEATYIKEL